MNVAFRRGGPTRAPCDLYGFQHSSPVAAAVAAFERATLAVLGHRPEAGPALDAMLAADPIAVAGHALRGLALVGLARRETMAAAGQKLVDARRAAAERAPSADEAALVEALAQAACGRFTAAADRLDHRLAENPWSILLVKLSHGLRFMRGDLAGMRRTTTAAVAALAPNDPGFGFVLGCHAFGLEEAGEYAEAERTGRVAVALEGADAWGLHAVTHVYEMTGRTDDGVAWLEAKRPEWKQCNNFAFHLSWHLALFHLEHGRHDAVLDLYDREVRPVATDDFRDVANAASLLWRLRQEGVAVGARWGELAEIASRRSDETTLIFASLHNLLALAAVGDRAGAAALAEAIAGHAGASEDDQGAIAAEVGRAVAAAVTSGRIDGLERTLGGVCALGGSHAQRDVFIRALTEAAVAAGDGAAAQVCLTARRRLRVEDRFDRFVSARMAGFGKA